MWCVNIFVIHSYGTVGVPITCTDRNGTTLWVRTVVVVCFCRCKMGQRRDKSEETSRRRRFGRIMSGKPRHSYSILLSHPESPTTPFPHTTLACVARGPQHPPRRFRTPDAPLVIVPAAHERRFPPRPRCPGQGSLDHLTSARRGGAWPSERGAVSCDRRLLCAPAQGNA